MKSPWERIVKSLVDALKMKSGAGSICIHRMENTSLYPAHQSCVTMRRTFLFPCLVALVAVQPLASQVRMDGIVIDDATDLPIPEARVRVFDGWGMLSRSRRADSTGNFSVTVKRLGVYRVQVRSPGYPDVSGTVITEAFPFQNIEVRMRKGAQLLAPVTILTRSQMLPTPNLQGFHDRLRNRLGAFLTREDVEAVRPGYISDMIAWTPGVLVRRGGQNNDDRFLFARRFAEGSRTEVVECPLRVVVDGEVVNQRTPAGEMGPVSVDFTVDQTMVDGIEIYMDPASVPDEFGGAAAAPCGAVVIWTRNRPRANPTGAVDADA
jgi:hypothetical protein